MAFNPTPRDMGGLAPGTFTPRGKPRQDRRTDAVRCADTERAGVDETGYSVPQMPQTRYR